MNKSYRSIWNEALGAWVAVSEIEKAKGKPAGSRVKVAGTSKWGTTVRAIVLTLGVAFTGMTQAYAASGTLNCTWTGSAASVNGQPGGNSGNHNILCGKGASGSTNESIAIGVDTRAPGAQSVALGSNVTAQGASSIAIGGDDLTVMPNELKVKYEQLTGNPLVGKPRYPRTTSNDGGVAVGVAAQAGKLATAFGARAHAQGDVSLALGVGSMADKENAIAIGAGSSTVGTQAVGISNVALDANKTVISNSATPVAYYRLNLNNVDFDFKAGNNLSDGDIVSFGGAGFERQLKYVAPGQVSESSTDAINGSQLYTVVDALTALRGNVNTLENTKTHFYSVNAQGVNQPTTAGNYNNDGATASKAIAAGVGASATAAKSVVVGSDSTVSGEQSVSIGSENLVSGRDTYVLGSGNHKRGNAEGGKVEISANNSTVVGKGNIVAAEADVHVQGNNNIVTRTHALVMGSDNTVSGNGTANEEPAIAIGSTNTVSHDNALAIGKSNNASAQSSIAVGVNSQATARSTVAIGNTAKATDENGLAIGSYAEAGNYATAVGSQARAKKAHGVAVGTTSFAGERATTVGRYSASHADSSIALGSDALVTAGAHAGIALGSGSVVSGAYSGALSSSIQNNQTINGNRAIDRRSVVGGQESYAIGNKNIVGSRSNDTFILGNNVKIGATGATLTTINITKAERTDAVAFQEEAAVIGAVALGSDTGVTVSDGVALGRGSKAATDKGVVGADPLNAVTDKNGAAWKSTKGAVAVGSTVDGYTRQITGLAAGKEDTDAVNVAQLKAAGFKVTTAASDGQVVGNTEEKIQNGELFTVDAGKNIKITQSGKKVSVATKDDVEFTSVTAGGNVLDGTAINVGGQTYTNVAAAINALAAGGSAAQTHYFSVHSTDQSDESNFNNGGATGNDALAAGRRAKASAAEAVAVGSDVTASGNQSLAVGNLVSATHLGATAIGNNAKALNTGAQAFGQSSEARGENSAAIGRLAIATGDRASAFGVGNTASGISSFSGGDKARSEGEKSIALGFESSVAATGSNAIAVGTSAVSAATNSVVIGSRASVAETGSGSVAIGAVSKANGVNATAVGQASEASGQNSFAGGQDSHATGKSSVAVGDGAKARVDSATAVGAYAHAGPEGTDEELATLLTSDKNAGAGASAFGISSKATTYRSLALGASSNASGGNSALAVGDSANASAGDAVAIGKSSAASAAQAVALGRQATANIAGGVAIGYMSKTEIDKGVSGADPLNVQANKTGNKVWTSTRAAVSVGDVEGGTTRQITGLAAGAQDTDAVNVAQLKAAGFQLQATASDGQVAGSAAQKVKNGDLFALDAGKNIKLSQSEGKISIATKEDVAFNSVTVDGVVINNAGINAGNKVITGVETPTADDHAANKAYVEGGRTQVKSSDASVAVTSTVENGANVYDLSVDTSSLAKADGSNLNIQYGGDNGSSGSSALNQSVQFNGTADEIVTEAANGSVTFKLADSVKNQIEANKAKSQQAFDKAAENAGRIDQHDTSIRGHAAKIAANETRLEETANKAGENTAKIAENAASIRQNADKIAQGLNFEGDKGAQFKRELGETVAVKGADANISTTADNGTISIELSKTLDLGESGSITTGATKVANNGITLTSADGGNAVRLSSDGLTIEGGPSVTKAGIDAAGKKITKVAAGQADDDAVNVGQLKDSDNIAKANMEALGGSYDAATDTYTRPNYVVKTTEGVAKPAVHTVQEALAGLNEEIEKPLTFAADKGADSTRKLGSTIGIKAGNFAGAASADNLVTENNGNGEITIKLADNPTFKGKVSAKGLDAGGLQITGVAQGEKGTDAVNVDQLRQAMKDITVENLALVAADSPFSYVNNAGDQLVRKVDDQGKAYFVKASDGKTRYEGDDIVVSALNAQDPQTSVATRVTNVGKGTKDTDAVNTAQLKEVLTALGTTLGEDGALVKPVYTVTRADGTPAATVNTVGEALGHLNAVLKDPITVSGNTNNGTSTIVAGGSDQKLGSKLQIKGALVDGASSSAANIRTVVTDGAVEIQLADAPTFAGKVSAQGFDAGNARITGVAEGTHAADAVNKAQLDAVADKVNAGWDLTANGSGRSKVAPGASVDLKNTDNNIVVSKADDSNDVTFNLAENLNIRSVTAGDSVLSSDGLAINNGPSITKAGINASGKAVSNIAAGKDAADAVNVSQLTPLAQALGVSVDTGSGTVTAPAFTVTKADGSRYEAADTIQGALNNIGSEIQKPITFAGDNAAGNFERKLGTTVNLKGGADEAKLSERNIGVVSNGSDTLDIKLSKELTGLTSAEFTDAQGNRSTVNGGSISFNHADGQKAATLDSDGLRINNGPSLTQNGLDAADTVIRNVAAGNVGENSKDAVNAGQLYAQGKGVEKLLGGSTRYNPADGSYTNNDIGGTGKNNLHEAIAAVHATAGAGWNLTAEGANSSNVAAGETVDLRSTDKNIVITKTAESDQVSFDLADAVTADSFTAGDTVVGTNGVAVGDKAALTAEGLTLGNAKNGKAPVVLNSDGLNNGGNAITNIAAGKNSNDAVNVSQLTPLASALGMAFDAANGGWSAPSFTVSRADGSTYPAVNTVQGALDHIGTEIRKPIRFAGNTGVAERKLDETLVVKGSLADNAQASDQNIRTKVEAGTLTIELAESPRFGGVTVNDNGKITGIESGNVAEGSKEAVTGGQLHAHGKGVESIIGGTTVYNPDTGTYTQADIGGTGAATVSDAIAAVRNTANTGWNLTAQGKNSSNVQPGETVDLRNNDGNIVVAKTDADDNVTFDLAKTLTVEAVKTGATKVDGSGVGVGDDVALTSDGLTVNNAANGKTVSLGSSGLNNGGNVITGLANGLMAEGSQEAVTGDQLFAVDKKVGENTAALNRGLDFAGNSGNFNRRLGERATIKGGLDNTVAASDTNVRTVADSTGNIQILLADAPVFKGKLKAQGLDAGGQKITGVKDGEEAGDAVNVSQLQRALDNQTITHQSLVQANSPFSYVNSRGEVLARQVDEKGKERFIKVVDGTEYTEKDISISSLNPLDPQTAVPTVVGNIADGKKDNDAANIGQLKNAVKALGGGAAVNADGSIKDPVYTIARNNGGRETVNNVGDALNLLNAELNKPLTFVGDNQEVKVVRSLDTELAVKGGANGKLTENNIGVTGSTDDNSLVIKLAENVNLGENGSVTTGKTVVNNSGVAVGGNLALTSDGLKAGGVSVSHSGIHAGGKTITGVKAGQEATDAVNKAQLDAVQAAASSKVAAQGNLTVKENTNEDGSTTYTLTTADDVNFSSVTSGKGANQVVLDDKGVNVGGKTYLTAQGINANGNKVSNVGKGSINADSTDAVTGSQLHGTASSLAKLFGGDATVNADGSVQMNNIGGTGAATVEEAIKAVNQAVVVSKVAVVQGDNIVVDKATNADGSATYTVSAAKDLKLDSVSVGGNTTINGNGISIANGPSLNANGLDAAGKKLTNVADGEISATSKEAVNGSQLYQAYQVLGGNNTSINMQDAPGTTGSDGNTTPAGTVTTVVTNPDGTQTTTVETNQKVAVSTDKGGNQYTLVTYNVEGQNTYVTNDVIQAIGKMNEQGIKFFHTNDGEVKAVAQGSNNEDSSASGAYATAIGFQTAASGQGAVALGNTYTLVDKDGKEIQGSDGKAKQQRTQATGKNAVAIGTGSQANNENTIAIGTGNIVNGKNAGAIGDPSVINGNNTYAVGNNNTVNGSNTFVLGNSVTETIDNSVVLGNEAAAKGVHKAATGSHYTYAGANDGHVAGVQDVVGVVSVGKEGQTRQIQNVAAGVVSPTSTDAVNGSQIYHTNEAINQVGNQVVNVGNYLNQRIDDIESKSNAGTAAAMAVAGLPQAYLPGKSMMAVSGSTYRGESGYAVGFSSISDNGNWVVKGTATGNSRGHYGATAGVGYQW